MIDFEKRLASLKNRRQGANEINILNERLRLEGRDLLKSESESFENLREPVGIKYAIGAMAPVGKKYTETSINEGNRVANAVTTGLHLLQESVTTRLQGSVALDIHIKGFSDVDMLIICNNPVTTQRPLLFPENYSTSKDPRTPTEIVHNIKINAFNIISSKFHAATVTQGNKAISVEGGSLTRKVDIVPSIWYDSHQYQKSKADHERGINIYDQEKYLLLANYPFMHIKRVNDRDSQYDGNMKSLIRLMKNMIADMPEYKNKKVKKLSSYDIASIVFHMESDLHAPYYMKLRLIENLRLHLARLKSNNYYKQSLDVPDGTRKIFDSTEKDEALEILSSEVTDLAISIASEINPRNSFNYNPSDLISKLIF